MPHQKLHRVSLAFILTSIASTWRNACIQYIYTRLDIVRRLPDLTMGLFDSKKKKAEKEAARAAAAARAQQAAVEQAAARKAASERATRERAAAKRNESDQRQEMAITEMRSLKEKISLWQKKVDKLQGDKKVILGRLAASKQKGLRLDESDKRRLAKVNKDIKLTQGQLETLENKLSGIEQAAANVSVVDTIAGANDITEKIAKPVDEVQDVLQKAEEQRQDLEEANMEFFLPTGANDYDEDELLEDLDEYIKVEAPITATATGAGPVASGAGGIPSVPTKQPQFQPAPVSTTEDDEIEAEIRRQEMKSMAV